MRPPRFFEWLYSLFLPAEFRQDALGDFEELFQERAERSERRARWWYRFQVLGGLPRLIASLAVQILSSIPRMVARDGRSRDLGLPSWFDVRHALGIVIREPGLSAVAVLVLALGVGSTTTMFGITHGLTRPLPIEDHEEIVRVARHEAEGGFRYTGMRAQEFEVLRSDQTSLVDVAATVARGFQVGGSGARPERVSGVQISPQAFGLLRVEPTLGRVFNDEDAAPGSPPVVILSHRLWQSRFGGSDALGQEVRVNDEIRTVVGVMPEDFGFPRKAEIWVPLTLAAVGSPRANERLDVFGRLQPGTTLEDARTEIGGIGTRISLARPEARLEATLRVEPFLERFVPPEDRLIINLMVLMAMSVLVIAATNVANVLLSRAVVRSKEAAIRMALGGSRLRVLSLRIIESLTLSVLGGLAGLALTNLSLGLFRRTLAANLDDFWMDIRLDGSVFVFTVACVFGATLLAGLLPALQTSGVDLNSAMRSESAGSTSSRRGRVSRFLVGSQLMLSCTMLILCGTMVLGARNLDSVDYSFEPERLLTGRIYLETFDYPDNEAQMALRARLGDRLTAIAGVEAVAFTTALPGARPTYRYEVEGFGYAEGQAWPTVEGRYVSPDFFGMFRMDRLEGRLIADADRDVGERVAVVNERFARRLGGGTSALGSRFRLGSGGDDGDWIRVVGVVADAGVSVRDGEGVEGIFLPTWDYPSQSMSFVVRVRSTEAILPTVLEAVSEVDPNLPVYSAAMLSDVLLAENRPERAFAVLFGAFGLIALGLAVVGLYGVVAFGVNQRFREIGIRRALGARGREIRWWTIREGIVPLLSGLALGVGSAWLIAPSMGELLFGADPRSPVMFTAVPLILTMAAGLGLWFPARRAVRVDPMTVLRTE